MTTLQSKQPATAKRTTKRFRLLQGKHAVDGPKVLCADGMTWRAEWEKQYVGILYDHTKNPPERVWDGDVFDSDIDLCKLYNIRDKSQPQKFEEVSKDTPLRCKADEDAARLLKLGESEPPLTRITEPTEEMRDPDEDNLPADTFDAMTVEELKHHAAAEEIDLGKAKTKQEIVAVLRAASQPA